MKNLSPFSKFNIATFSLIWLGFAVYSLVKNVEHKWTIVFFSTAFSIVLIAAVWFSEWLIFKYRAMDKLREDMLRKKSLNTRRV